VLLHLEVNTALSHPNLEEYMYIWNLSVSSNRFIVTVSAFNEVK